MLDTAEYDAVIVAVGYEQRSRFVGETVSRRASRRYACAFAKQKVLEHQENARQLTALGFDVQERSDEAFSSWLKEVLADVIRKTDRARYCRICFDISSLSRFRMASAVECLAEASSELDFEVDFLYAPAKYDPPPREPAPIMVCGPVTASFAGWSSAPEQKTIVIFGLGYELEKAVGAWEFLEPSLAWAFVPTGADKRYDKAVQRANQALWEMLPSQNLVEYHVESPFDAFVHLESLSYGNLSSGKVVLIPFGPKIFSLCCLLVATVHWPQIGVWRVSSGELEPAVNRVPNRKIVGLRVRFERDLQVHSASP